jgi:FkbM family methyltransferase
VKIENQRFILNHFGQQIENEIFWAGIYGGWEATSMRIWTLLAKQPSHAILDIGANTGIYSLVAATINKDAKIYAFEPVKRVYARLNLNKDLNQFSNIHTYELGVSNYTGVAEFFDPGSDHVLSVSVNRDLTEGNQPTTPTQIQVQRLDDWARDQNILQIDLIKLDVEYHEPQSLEGMGALLNEHRPSFLVEVLTDEIAERINSLILNLNYTIFDIDEKSGLTRINRVAKSSTFNVLLLSEKHEYLLEDDMLHSLIR